MSKIKISLTSAMEKKKLSFVISTPVTLEGYSSVRIITSLDQGLGLVGVNFVHCYRLHSTIIFIVENYPAIPPTPHYGER